MEARAAAARRLDAAAACACWPNPFECGPFCPCIGCHVRESVDWLEVLRQEALRQQGTVGGSAMAAMAAMARRFGLSDMEILHEFFKRRYGPSLDLRAS